MRQSEYPGLAKFGIALEWGSRGRWFESSNSDHKNRKSISSFGFYFFLGGFEPTPMQQSGGLLLADGLDGGHTFIFLLKKKNANRIQQLGPKGNHRKVVPFFFLICYSGGKTGEET